MRHPWLVALFALFSDRLMAHHVNDMQLPRTFTEGLLSGLAHPVIGPDHLAFIIALGLVAYMIKKPVQLPLFFVGGTLAGCFAHMAGIDLPMVEPMIASSVVLVGALIALKSVGEGSKLWLPAALIAGAIHGYAYGESIIGSVTSALTAYLIGFAVVQFVVATAIASLAAAVPAIRVHSAKIGVVLSAIGGYLLFNAI